MQPNSIFKQKRNVVASASTISKDLIHWSLLLLYFVCCFSFSLPLRYVACIHSARLHRLTMFVCIRVTQQFGNHLSRLHKKEKIESNIGNYTTMRCTRHSLAYYSLHWNHIQNLCCRLIKQAQFCLLGGGGGDDDDDEMIGICVCVWSACTTPLVCTPRLYHLNDFERRMNYIIEMVILTILW